MRLPAEECSSPHSHAAVCLTLTSVPQVGKAVGSEGLVAGQVVDIKSEGAGTSVGIETLQVRARGNGQGGTSRCLWCTAPGWALRRCR